jgi:transcriptional regulator with XRE-family HTH domain
VPGRKLLNDWFAANESRTRAGLGERLGISGQAVGGWARGIARPDEGHMRKLLELATEGAVPEASWETEKEKAQRSIEIARARGVELKPTGT